MDEVLLEIPRPQACLKYLLRAHVKAGGRDLSKYLKQVHVRPFVLILLLDFLILRNHEVFRGKGSAVELRQKMREAVTAQYPETEASVPEVARMGTIPASILEALQQAAAESQAAQESKQQTAIHREKGRRREVGLWR